jgi:hypothetical protein
VFLQCRALLKAECEIHEALHDAIARIAPAGVQVDVETMDDRATPVRLLR